MAKKIIGFTGEIASGKSTAAQHLIDVHGAVSFRFSTPLRDVALRLGVEQNRENLQFLSTTLRTRFGEDLLAKIITKDAEASDENIIVIDGIRRLADISYLSKLPEFKLVYMDADMEVRYERITQRGENTDDLSKTLDEFKKDSEDESEQQIKGLREHADFVIDNNKGIANTKDLLDAIMKV